MGFIQMFFLLFCFLGLTLADVCPGCKMHKDTDNPTYNEILKRALSHYSSTPKGSKYEKIDLIRIISVSTQVVSGIKYIFDFEGQGTKSQQFYKCNLQVISKRWKHLEEVTGFTCQPISSRNKRSVPGSEYDTDINEKTLHKLRGPILRELYEQQKPQYQLGIVKIFRATQQVISGLLTKITVEIAETRCLPDNNETVTGCETEFQHESHQVCTIDVWERPWLNKTVVEIKKCSKAPHFCAGCLREISSDDEMATNCLKRTLFNLSKKSQSKKEWALREIYKIYSQVVAGVKYIIYFAAEDEKKSLYTCRVVIVSQPWISDEPVVDNFECGPTTQS